MNGSDTYQTILTNSEGIYKEKGSKFFAFAYPVKNLEEVKSKLDFVKELHPKAKHHCYAYQIGINGTTYRANDAGEPNGTAGLPILGQLKSFQVTNVLVIVVRYFGGTKLGVSGLVNAYKSAAIDTLNNATIIEKIIADYYAVDFEYDQMNNVMRICKEFNLIIINQVFEIKCNITLEIPHLESEHIISQLELLQNVKTKYLCTT